MAVPTSTFYNPRLTRLSSPRPSRCCPLRYSLRTVASTTRKPSLVPPLLLTRQRSPRSASQRLPVCAARNRTLLLSRLVTHSNCAQGRTRGRTSPQILGCVYHKTIQCDITGADSSGTIGHRTSPTDRRSDRALHLLLGSIRVAVGEAGQKQDSARPALAGKLRYVFT